MKFVASCLRMWLLVALTGLVAACDDDAPGASAPRNDVGLTDLGVADLEPPDACGAPDATDLFPSDAGALDLAPNDGGSGQDPIDSGTLDGGAPDDPQFVDLIALGNIGHSKRGLQT